MRETRGLTAALGFPFLSNRERSKSRSMKRKEDCLFCRMIEGEIPVRKVYEDEWVMAIRDLYPLCEHHILLFPKYHVENYFDTELGAESWNEELEKVMLAMQKAVPKILRQEKLEEYGVRLIQNNGARVGQSVMHLHWHLLSGPSADEGLRNYFCEFCKKGE